MVKFNLDGREMSVAEGTTVFKAAKLAGTHIPHLCFHPAFEPEGSCRLCLVEIEDFPKLELACSTVVREGMKVRTSSPRVVEARWEVLEFLLAEHPLDCPICDKAGECKLQDYYEAYGRSDGGSFEEKERREKKLFIGKNLILDRERCVLCRRCVRFLENITATEELGVFERGIRSEVGIWEDRTVTNNYSGNLVDICPVGAITDSDFRFKTRAWFLESRASVCPLCGRGCSIFIDFHPGFPRIKGSKKILRVRARENESVNRFWICDVGRYGFRYLQENRADRVLKLASGKASASSWDEAVRGLAEAVVDSRRREPKHRTALVINTFLTNEELDLIRTVFGEEYEAGRVHICDPAAGNPDGFLLTAERSVNRRGAAERGFRLGLPGLQALSTDLDLLIVFGVFLLEHFGEQVVRDALRPVPAKYLLTPHRSALDEAFDWILPVSLTAEKSGTVTNCDGNQLEFKPAWDPPGDGRSEAEILRALDKEISLLRREP